MIGLGHLDIQGQHMNLALQHGMFVIGGALLASGIILAFLRRDRVTISVFIVIGALCAMAGLPGVSKAAFKVMGVSGELTMYDVKQEYSGDLAGLQLRMERIEKQIQVLATPASTIFDKKNAITPAFNENSKYSVLVFYRAQRKEDAEKILQAALSKGYQSSITMSSLQEVQIGQQPDNSTFIIPTQRGEEIVNPVRDLVSSTLPPPRNGSVTVGSSWPLRRGDVQVYLF